MVVVEAPRPLIIDNPEKEVARHHLKQFEHQVLATHNLHHIVQAPASDLEAADGDMVRAYKRLIAIQADQWERGDIFDLPHLAQAA